MPQHENVPQHPQHPQRSRWTIPNLPPLPATGNPGDSANRTPAEVAALHLAEARRLRAEAAEVRRELRSVVGELRGTVAEWQLLRAAYAVYDPAHLPSADERARMAAAEDRLTALDSRLRYKRTRWARLHWQALGHELAAIYEDASAEPSAEPAGLDEDAPADAGPSVPTILAQLARESDRLAFTLHTEALDIEEGMTRTAAELAPAVAEWSALLGLPSMTDAQAERSAALEGTIRQLSRTLERQRSRWRQVEQDAQGQNLTAAYLRAHPA